VAADGTLTDIGKRRLMGLGSAHDISLATVRELARKAREQVVLGIYPIDVRDEVFGTQRASRQAGKRRWRRGAPSACVSAKPCDAWPGYAITTSE
jgi:hypothetical protein